MIIYRILNEKNGKCYIGQSVNSFDKRYKGGKWWLYTHNEILKNSYLKNGSDSFIVEILKENIDSLEELNHLEEYYANMYNAYRPNGYNIRGCGDNKFVSDDLKKHLSTFRLGKDYKPSNKKHSIYKGVSWKDSKKSWVCRIQNSFIKKDKYTSSEIEAAEMYDKVSLYLFGQNSYINFESKREEYIDSNLESFYNTIFMTEKKKRVDGYLKDLSSLLENIKPLLWEKTIPEISKILDVSVRKIQYCLEKHNIERPGKNYWQKNKINKND